MRYWLLIFAFMISPAFAEETPVSAEHPSVQIEKDKKQTEARKSELEQKSKKQPVQGQSPHPFYNDQVSRMVGSTKKIFDDCAHKFVLKTNSNTQRYKLFSMTQLLVIA